MGRWLQGSAQCVTAVTHDVRRMYNSSTRPKPRCTVHVDIGKSHTFIPRDHSLDTGRKCQALAEAVCIEDFFPVGFWTQKNSEVYAL